MKLAAIMGAVLLASVGVATWLSRSRGAPVRTARDVLSHIRDRGLQAFWGDGPETLWYLTRDANGTPIGWWRYRRTPTEGGFEGGVARRLGAGYYEERWSLDRKARRGEYIAEQYGLSRPLRTGVPRLRKGVSTIIALSDGKVAVDRRRPTGRQAKGIGQTPDNYVPEGLLSLVFYLTAAGGETGSYALIFNETSLGPGGVYFSEAQVVPDGPQRVEVTFGTPAAGAQWTEVREYDDRGRLVLGRRPREGITWRRVSYEAVLEAFPEAQKIAEEDRRREGRGPGNSTTAPEG